MWCSSPLSILGAATDAANAEIFKVQGRALNEAAQHDARVLIVGTPAMPATTTVRNEFLMGR
jgi:malate/lactate dehydrogenase